MIKDDTVEAAATGVVPDFELVDTSTEVPIPAHIVTAIEKNATKFKDRNIPKDPPNYNVTNLAWCSRLTYYHLMQFPREILDSDGFNSGFNLYRGNSLHWSFSRIYRWSELPLKVEFSISRGRSVTISARLDMYDPDSGGTILDLKTTKWASWQKRSSFLPRKKDLRQLAIYEYLYAKLAKILPVKKLTLLYLDMAEIFAYDLPIPNDTERWLRARIESIEDARETKIAPTGEVTALCSYCPFQSRCRDDAGGITTTPKSHPEENLQ